MWTKIQNGMNLLRRHLVATVLSCLAIGATGGAGTFWSVYEAGVNRREEMKIADFQALVADHRKFLDDLNAFTEELATTGAVNKDIKKSLSAVLVRQYHDFGAFAVNLPPEQEPPLRELQTSLNEVKKRVQLTESKQDLDPLGLALVVMFRQLKVVQPILEENVGKSFPVPTG